MLARSPAILIVIKIFRYVARALPRDRRCSGIRGTYIWIRLVEHFVAIHVRYATYDYPAIRWYFRNLQRSHRRLCTRDTRVSRRSRCFHDPSSAISTSLMSRLNSASKPIRATSQVRDLPQNGHTPSQRHTRHSQGHCARSTAAQTEGGRTRHAGCPGQAGRTRKRRRRPKHGGRTEGGGRTRQRGGTQEGGRTRAGACPGKGGRSTPGSRTGRGGRSRAGARTG